MVAFHTSAIGSDSFEIKRYKIIHIYIFIICATFAQRPREISNGREVGERERETGRACELVSQRMSEQAAMRKLCTHISNEHGRLRNMKLLCNSIYKYRVSRMFPPSWPLNFTENMTVHRNKERKSTFGSSRSRMNGE